MSGDNKILIGAVFGFIAFIAAMLFCVLTVDTIEAASIGDGCYFVEHDINSIFGDNDRTRGTYCKEG